MSTTAQIYTTSHPYLRSFDARRDLLKVADLVEKCFASNLDQDGMRYLGYLRSTAGKWDHLGQSVIDRLTWRFSGFVWEDDGQIVGNLSLIPMTAEGEKVYLIANVAVDPMFQHRGIARMLTESAIDAIRQMNVRTAWLQVRKDNTRALHLYRSMDFLERDRRTTWVNFEDDQASMPDSDLFGFVVGPRKRAHWELQQKWFDEAYPPAISWNLAIHRKCYSPGIPGWFSRHFKEVEVEQFSVTYKGELLGVVIWQPSRGYADYLWLAAPLETEDQVIRSVFPQIRVLVYSTRPVRLEYPEGRGVSTLSDAGFTAERTLIWMERTL